MMNINAEFRFESLDEALEAMKYYLGSRYGFEKPLELDWIISLNEKIWVLDVELFDMYDDMMYSVYDEDCDEYAWDL